MIQLDGEGVYDTPFYFRKNDYPAQPPGEEGVFMGIPSKGALKGRDCLLSLQNCKDIVSFLTKEINEMECRK